MDIVVGFIILAIVFFLIPGGIAFIQNKKFRVTFTVIYMILPFLFALYAYKEGYKKYEDLAIVVYAFYKYCAKEYNFDKCDVVTKNILKTAIDIEYSYFK